jgi:hypothetical protein
MKLLKIAVTPVILMLVAASCRNRDFETIQNSKITADLFTAKPVFRNIIYEGDTLKPLMGKGITVNGKLAEWSSWNIKSSKTGDTVIYKMALRKSDIKADFLYWLDSSTVKMKIRNVQDPKKQLKELGFSEQPWVSVSDSAYKWWTVRNWTRVPFVKQKIFSRGIGYYNSLYGNGCDTIQKAGMSTYACIWKPEKLCFAVRTNMNVFPISFYSHSGYCNLGPNKYYYRVQDKLMPDYEAELIFFNDLNENKKYESADYRIWLNRQIKGADERHKTSVWYKIYLNDIHNADNPCTTLKQAKEIITYVNNITDGIPQIIYLVGWQYKGHDTGYPALDKLNEAMGTREELLSLSKYCDSLNSVLSMHCNIDDAYKANRDFTPDIMGTDYDGTPIFWEIFADSAFHISHYKDVKTGSIFRRLEEMMSVFPLQKSIHFDAMRITNCNPEWEKDGNGMVEEFELGLKPIVQWLNNKGITVTTETQNGNPIDLSPLVAGVWTYFHLIFEYKQIYHGKIVAGGTPESMATLRYSSGIGNSITQDFSYKKYHGQLPFETEREKIKDIIYQSSLLYHFLNKREMLEANRDDNGYLIRFSGGVTSRFDNSTNHLEVKWNDVLLANDDDRFIPVHGGIYAYSLKGSDCSWVLPQEYRNRGLKIYEVTGKGRKAFTGFRIEGDKIRLKLGPHQAVKILAE